MNQCRLKCKECEWGMNSVSVIIGCVIRIQQPNLIMNRERQHRRVWTQEQDSTLKLYVEQSADPTKPKWKEISQQLNASLQLEFKRNPKQCRERWFNSLAPSSQQVRHWQIEDDVTLIRACKKYGHRWSRLAKQFDQNINDNRLKNHFYSTVRKIVRVINSIVKQSKKQYQQHVKSRSLHAYSEQQLQVMKQISKLRVFEPKLLSKVFSLIDEKQEYRYQAKESLEVEEVKAINDQILDYMEDFVTGRNEFTKQKILCMIGRIMHVNRTIKTKYVREVKLSVQDDNEIMKEQENRKKREKKINIIVKEELENKIIPDRKTKNQIINKIGDQNKKLRRLIKPNAKRRAPKNKNQQEKSVIDELSVKIKEQLKEEPDDLGLMESDDVHSQNSKSKSNKVAKTKETKKQNYGSNQDNEDQDQVVDMANFYGDQDVKNSKYYNNSIKIKLNSPPSISFSSMFGLQPQAVLNNVSYTYDDFTRKDKLQKSVQSWIQKQSQPNFEIRGQRQKQSRIDYYKKQQIKDHPFASNFLNNIPCAPSSSKENKKYQVDEIRGIFNPFFPEYKQSHSQGYFCFNEPNNEVVVEKQQNQVSKSNPILNSLNLIDGHQPMLEQGQTKSSKMFKNSKIGNEGLFGSYNYSSNNDKMSEQKRMESSLFDLAPNFHPLNSAFYCPVLFGTAKQNENQLIRENRMIEISRPFSAHDNKIPGYRFNMQQSQPMDFYRSADLHADSNPSGAGLYHSYSFGQHSQENKSNRSKRKN